MIRGGARGSKEEVGEDRRSMGGKKIEETREPLVGASQLRRGKEGNGRGIIPTDQNQFN